MKTGRVLCCAVLIIASCAALDPSPSVNPALTPGGRDVAGVAARVAQAPPLAEADRPRGLIGGETRLGLSLADARAIQRALCDAGPADGDFGPAGGMTRAAIAGFQRARALRSPREVTGVLRDADASELLGAGPCPPAFRTAFERFYFGDPTSYATPDPGRLAGALAAVGAPAAGGLAELRAAMARSGTAEADLAAMLTP